jgi:hypothetical protein
MKALERRLSAAEARIPGNCNVCSWRAFQDMPQEQLRRRVRELEVGNMVCASDDEIEDFLEEAFSERFGLTFDIGVRRLAEKLIENHTARA